ncbi:cell number regulator 3-like [Branchiostoma floridae]|uniref:Cell number regulator 3-like n=1 Tax=Branchiostoma floridae TaxID=7739 RepID=C3YCY7_BRAFL|nr:cell number regulator 3-like [Branchiostoma floridae]|eukprot:XP_002605928.1 hypothetical protein BRAFLDRAFT_87397 [Branchiostoma floridae]
MGDASQAVALSGKSSWKVDMFSCFDNFGLCCMTFCCPCVTAGKNAEAAGEDCFRFGLLSMMGPIGMYSMAYTRTKIAEKEGIPADFTTNMMIYGAVPLCALIQEAQQVEGAKPPAQGQMSRD